MTEIAIAEMLVKQNKIIRIFFFQRSTEKFATRADTHVDDELEKKLPLTY